MVKLIVRCVFFPLFVGVWLVMMAMSIGVAGMEWLWDRAELD